MTRKENLEESYIYFAKVLCYSTLTYWKTLWLSQGHSEKEVARWISHEREVKIGETASYKSRYDKLYYSDNVKIKRYVKFVGTKEERLFIEAYIRSKYSTNKNMIHHGNDYFSCCNSNTIKGAEHKFFEYVAEGFSVLSAIKGKDYDYICEAV